jgi:transcriptional regulator with XRE-family HTH domain
LSTANSTPVMVERAASRALNRHLQARVIGQRLSWSREAAGVSQRELADYLGCSRTTISFVESGRRALRPAERVAAARALGTSIALLSASAMPPASNGNGKAAA